MQPSGELRDRIAVVTGGTGGIGAATARLLAQAGASVVIGYNSGEDRARRLLQDLPGAGHDIARIRLEDAGTINALARNLQEKFGRLDMLINSAGFTRPIPHHDLSSLDEAQFDAMLIGNARGPYSVIRAMAPLLRASGAAVVVNVSSISAFTGSGSNIAYCAAKAALDTLTMSLARALGPEIRLLCVSPGAVATDFVAGRDRMALVELARNTPLRRVIEAEDVALAIMACITHLKASTGTCIVVDGGRHL